MGRKWQNKINEKDELWTHQFTGALMVMLFPFDSYHSCCGKGSCTVKKTIREILETDEAL